MAPSSATITFWMLRRVVSRNRMSAWQMPWMSTVNRSTSAHRLVEMICSVDSAATSAKGDRKSTRLNSSHVATSYAVFCLKKKDTFRGSGHTKLPRAGFCNELFLPQSLRQQDLTGSIIHFLRACTIHILTLQVYLLLIFFM